MEWPPKKGIYWDLFVNLAMAKLYECQECNLLAKVPVELTCEEHMDDEGSDDDSSPQFLVFCEGCLTSKLKQNGGRCVRQNHPNPQWQRSVAVGRSTNRLIVRCPRRVRQKTRLSNRMYCSLPPPSTLHLFFKHIHLAQYYESFYHLYLDRETEDN